MAGEYVSQEADLRRVTNLRRIAGSAHSTRSTEEFQRDILMAFSELGRRVELELDRIYTALRAIDAATGVGVSAAVDAAETGGLWEYVDGNLVPKDPDA